LKQLGAVGLVVEAPSLEAYQALKVLAGDLFLAPVTTPEVAQQLGLSHYPVLITATRIEQ
jgi:integrating conjugative element protein (TIGR03765 family)